MMRDHYPKMAAQTGTAETVKQVDFVPRIFEFSELLIDKLKRYRCRRVLSAHGHATLFLPLASFAAGRREAGTTVRGVRGLT